MKRSLTNQKTVILFFLISTLFVVGITTWFEIKEYLLYSRIQNSDKGVQLLKSKIQKSSPSDDATTSRFNLGVLYYKDKQFENAIRQFEDLLNQNKTTDQIKSDSFYNIGNSYFKKVESSPDLSVDQKLLILQKSLNAYRGAKDIENRMIRVGGGSEKKDRDLAHNYQLVRQHIKLIKDQLKNDRQRKDQNMTPYQLIKEITKIELELQILLETGHNKKELEEKRKEQLLKLKEESLNKLSILKDKLNRSKSEIPPVHFQKQGIQI